MMNLPSLRHLRHLTVVATRMGVSRSVSSMEPRLFQVMLRIKLEVRCSLQTRQRANSIPGFQIP
jgi:hypothetical protein